MQTAEAGRQLAAIEVLALARLNGAESRTGLAANRAARERTLGERAVLLGLLAVAREGFGQRLSGRGRVGTGSVVHVCLHAVSGGHTASKKVPTRM